MKKLTTLLLTGVMALGLAGCGSTEGTTTTGTTTTGGTESGDDVVRIALLLPFVGDQSYMDVTNNGLNLVKEKYDDQVDTVLVEMGRDSASWETSILQTAQEGYDIIISGNFEYEPYMIQVAAQFPDIAYINFDYSDPEANKEPGNIYGMTYKGEEIGYLAGVVAAIKTESNIVGCVGGQENPSLQNMLGGFIQGAQTVNPDITVVTGWVGDFNDTAKAKEIAGNMFDQGADVIWQCAGGAGNGVFEAAAEDDFWAIGVDSDQYTALSGRPEIAAKILTSSEKRCDNAILDAVTRYMENDHTLPFGDMVSMGVAEGAVGLSENENYLNNMTEEELAEVDSYEQMLIDGEVELIDCQANPDQFEVLVASAA